jgi:hypothetical protein
MSKSEKFPASGDLIMKSVIICGDIALVAKANATLQRLGCRPEVNVHWTIKSWPANTLNQAASVERTLIEAADAHLIVIPAWLAHSLPFFLRDWLERWAALRLVKDAALAIIGDGIDTDITEAVSPELALLARKHGLNFFTDERPSPKNAAKLVVRFSRERELPVPVEQSHLAYAVTCDPYRGFGINE